MDVLLIQTVKHGKIHVCCEYRSKRLDCNLPDLKLDEWMYYKLAVVDVKSERKGRTLWVYCWDSVNIFY